MQYGMGHADIMADSRKATELTRRISIAELAARKELKHEESVELFEQSEEGHRLKGQENAERLLQRIYRQQAERMGKPGPEMAVRRSWVTNHISSSIGLGAVILAKR